MGYQISDITVDTVKYRITSAIQKYNNLAILINDFDSTAPFVVEAEHSNDNGIGKYIVTRSDSVPLSIAASVGEIIHELRLGLDYTAFHLIKKADPNIKAEKIYFPISETRDGFERYRKVISCLKPDIVTTIESIQPFNCPGHIIFDLHKLDNINKHRFLLPVGSAIATRSPRFEWINPDMSQTYNGKIELGGSVSLPDVTFPLAIGTVVGEITQKSNDTHKASLDVRFDLVFHGLDVAEGYSVVGLTNQLINTTAHLIADILSKDSD